jgi:hypothetical protein
MEDLLFLRWIPRPQAVNFRWNNLSSGGFHVHTLVILGRITNHPPYATANYHIRGNGVWIMAVSGKM